MGRPKKAAGPKTPAGEKWDAAAGEAEKPPKMAQVPLLDIGDERTEFEDIELRVPISDDEADLLEHRATSALAEADEEQRRLNEYSEPIKARIKALRKDASKDAKDAHDRSREVVQRTEVIYSPNTRTVRFLHPDTHKPVQLSRAMTEAEYQRVTKGAEPPNAPPEGERVDVDVDPLAASDMYDDLADPGLDE